MKRYLRELVILLAVFGGLPFDVASDANATPTKPPLRVAGGIQVGTSDTTIYVTAYGCKGDGATDDTTCFQNAAAALVAGNTLIIPAGNYKLTDAVTFSTNYIHVVGAGTGATTITFAPSATKSAFKFSAGASEQAGCSIEGMTFVSSGGNTQTKTAVEVVDNDGFVMRNIWVDPADTGTWVNGSIGLRVRGRQLMTVSTFRAFADKPIVISSDPNTSAEGLDHGHFSDLYLRPTPSSGNAAILIDADVYVSNFRLDGYQSWIVDKYGLYWSEATAVTGPHINVDISGVRCEQAVDATGYCIYIDTTQTLQDLDIHDSHMPTGQNGIHLNGFQNATIANVLFAASSHAHLDIGATASDLRLINNWVNTGAIVNMGSLVKVSAEPVRLSAQAMPGTGHFSDSSAAARTSTLSSNLTVAAAVIDTPSAANIQIGPTTQNGVVISRSGVRLESKGPLQLDEGFAPAYTTSATPVSVFSTHYFVGVTGSGARTVNLPAASSCKQAGQQFIIQEIGGSSGTITINRAGSDTINGATTATISAAYGALIFTCDHVSAWYTK